MPLNGKFASATKMVNGVEVKMGIVQWAQETLSHSDYLKFDAAWKREQAIWKAAEDAGTVVKTPWSANDLGSTAFDYTFNGDVESDAEYRAFELQYMADPSLIWHEDHGVMSEV